MLAVVLFPFPQWNWVDNGNSAWMQQGLAFAEIFCWGPGSEYPLIQGSANGGRVSLVVPLPKCLNWVDECKWAFLPDFGILSRVSSPAQLNWKKPLLWWDLNAFCHWMTAFDVELYFTGSGLALYQCFCKDISKTLIKFPTVSNIPFSARWNVLHQIPCCVTANQTVFIVAEWISWLRIQN